MSEARGPQEQFFAFLQEGSFKIQRCRASGEHIFYPRVSCPHCGSGELEWVEASGRGTIYSVTVVSRKPELGGNYNIALIDLAEGPRMMSCVAGLAPDKVQIGMPVMAVVRPQESPSLVFKPAGDINV